MISISEAKARLTELVRIADDEPVFLLRHSKPAGVVLSHSRYEELMERLEDAEDRVAILEHRLSPDETVPLEDLAQELGVRLPQRA